MKSAHKDLLNRLVDVQESMYYAILRPILREAEMLIVNLETENTNLREALKRTIGCLIGLGYETDPTTEFARETLKE